MLCIEAFTFCLLVSGMECSLLARIIKTNLVSTFLNLLKPTVGTCNYRSVQKSIQHMEHCMITMQMAAVKTGYLIKYSTAYSSVYYLPVGHNCHTMTQSSS